MLIDCSMIIISFIERYYTYITNILLVLENRILENGFCRCFLNKGSVILVITETTDNDESYR